MVPSFNMDGLTKIVSSTLLNLLYRNYCIIGTQEMEFTPLEYLN